MKKFLMVICAVAIMINPIAAVAMGDHDSVSRSMSRPMKFVHDHPDLTRRTFVVLFLASEYFQSKTLRSKEMYGLSTAGAVFVSFLFKLGDILDKSAVDSDGDSGGRAKALVPSPSYEDSFHDLFQKYVFWKGLSLCFALFYQRVDK